MQKGFGAKIFFICYAVTVNEVFKKWIHCCYFSAFFFVAKMTVRNTAGTGLRQP